MRTGLSVAWLAVALVVLTQASISLAANTRHYNWTIQYATIAPDCVTKTVATINGEYPGPTISARTGDRVVVEVCSNITYGVAMHWHGLHMYGQQWNDGPAHGALCPIETGQCFTYNFTIDGQYGTFWYHAHIQLQRASLYGAIIVYPPTDTPAPFATPKGEFTMLLNDWYHRYNIDIDNGLRSKQWQFIGSADAFLVNGRGLVWCKDYVCPYTVNKQKCGKCDRSSPFCNPLSTFVVEKGYTYRIRLVNVGLFAQMNFAIQNHNFTIVMTDGHYLKPVNYSSIDLAPAQSFDILVTFDQAPKNYWIAVNGRYDNFGQDPPGLAVIKYKGNKHFDQPQPYTQWPAGIDYKDTEFGPHQQQSYRDYHGNGALKGTKVDRYFSIMWNQNLIDGYIRYSVNNQSFYRSTTPLLAADYFNIPGAFVKKNFLPEHFQMPSASASALGLQPAKYATNILTMYKNEFVQIVLQNHNPPGGNHPWHLHGHEFYVVGYGSGMYNRSLESEYEKTYNLVDPHMRNMVTVYQDTWVAIRFRAHTGVWNMHCHMEPHMELGMQLYIHVIGGPGDIPPPPPGIPMCGKLLKYNLTDGNGTTPGSSTPIVTNSSQGVPPFP